MIGEGLNANFRCVGDIKDITRRMIEDRKFSEHCFEKDCDKNLKF